jgi:CubicO group peptidase (beta-lactamase class C family)
MGIAVRETSIIPTFAGKDSIMRSLAIFLILSSASAFAQKQKPTADSRLSGLDAQLQALVAEWKTSGFAVAVVEKNKVVYAKGFGYRDVERKLPVTPNTLFAIGSCTKAFTSGLLGILRSEQKVDFASSPSFYVPELKFFNDEMNNQITVRDLMCHRTGLPRHDFSWYLFNSDDRDSLIRRIKFHEPTAKVRERYQYNNFMFLAQGVITEKVAGKTWEQQIRENYFGPLQMTTSNVSMVEMSKAAEPALGYIQHNDKTLEPVDYYHIRGMAPAGSINSSVNEMANWVITWIHGGKFNGKEILPPDYVTEAMTPQIVTGLMPTKEHPDIHASSYGLGWSMASYRGHYRVEHGGAIDGFQASTCFFPTDSIGVVVLANQGGSVMPSLVRNTIVDRMLRLPSYDWNAELRKQRADAEKAAAEARKSKQSSRKPGTRLSHAPQDYTGRFGNDGYGHLSVILKNDSLFLTSPQNKMWLRHFHYDVFEAFELSKSGRLDTTEEGLKVEFRADLAGDLSTLAAQIEPALDHPIEFSRAPDAKKLTTEELAAYAGDYDISGQPAKVYAKPDGKLYLFIAGQPDYELVYTGSDRFVIKALKGFSLQFDRGAGKKVSGVSFIQPNGIFKATKK